VKEQEQLATLLKQYRDFSVKLLEVLKEEKYETLEKLLQERQKILDEIKLITYAEDKFQEISEQLELQKLETELIKLTTFKRDQVKLLINKLSEQKTAHKSYKSKFSVDPLYFNKKF
jgi:hypothetical protein